MANNQGEISLAFATWKPAGRDAKVYNNILEVIGNTPLVKLNRIPQDYGLKCEFYAKCEFMNPGGSIKDRMAYTMVVDAEDTHRAVPDVRFVEPTSGNTGIGLALTAAIKGYKTTIVTPDKNSDEKLSAMRLLGADIVQTSATAKLGDPDHYMTVVQQMVKDDKSRKTICLNQFSNPVNPLTHTEHTGREIVDALGRVDMAVMGAGTGGTVTGVARLLKRASPDCCIVAAHPVGSIIWGHELAPFYVEGIGDDFVPDVLDKSIIDKVVDTTDIDSFNMAREICLKEGLLCGGSSGAAMVAALQAAKDMKLGARKKVVVVLPDGIRNYMSKFVSDQWMEAHLFKEPPRHTQLGWWNKPLRDLQVDSVPTVQQTATCDEALTAMGSTHSVAIVTDDKGLFIGAIDRNQLRHAATNPKTEKNLDLKDPVKKHLIQNCFKVVENTGTPTVGLVSRILDIAPFVVKVEKIPNPDSKIKEIFKPRGVITSETLWQYIQKYLHQH